MNVKKLKKNQGSNSTSPAQFQNEISDFSITTFGNIHHHRSVLGNFLVSCSYSTLNLFHNRFYLLHIQTPSILK